MAYEEAGQDAGEDEAEARRRHGDEQGGVTNFMLAAMAVTGIAQTGLVLTGFLSRSMVLQQRRTLMAGLGHGRL